MREKFVCGQVCEICVLSLWVCMCVCEVCCVSVCVCVRISFPHPATHRVSEAAVKHERSLVRINSRGGIRAELL